MKKLLVTTLSIVLFSSVAMAQSPIHLGMKLGANYSELKTDDNDFKTEAAAGFLGGIFLRVDLPKKLLIQPEVYYSLKKSAFKGPSLNTQGQVVERKDNINKGDIDIALLLGYKIVDLKLFNLRLMAGAVNYMNIDDNLKEGYDDFEKNSMGYQAGIGADVANFTFDIRYEGSFGEIQKDVKYQGYQVSIGFKFI